MRLRRFETVDSVLELAEPILDERGGSAGGRWDYLDQSPPEVMLRGWRTRWRGGVGDDVEAVLRTIAEMQDGDVILTPVGRPSHVLCWADGVLGRNPRAKRGEVVRRGGVWVMTL